MSHNETFTFESLIFNYIDELKFLLFPDQWSNAFLDYSKNEILTLLILYRKKNVNMSEIAEYINAPLNTATGVVGRLEKKMMVERKRDSLDRRVVNIVLTEKGNLFMEEEKKSFEYYFKEIFNSLTAEEKAAAMSIFNKTLSILKKGKSKDDEKSPKKVKRIIIE
ncbi:MarR family winged helix-turn-helix transcriptional regulator [Clostridium paridis]|uniref:MarR family transcriptional regulator n=1 Tax=Clostridium paridis TaxID=2803863 RepID=A0A937FI26_9CLOT|nr:MarR family transcriptional regulator [Clostridium paridis]MBL4931936.1 MarR family transcriptional regulator [Clostridium paridis]